MNYLFFQPSDAFLFMYLTVLSIYLSIATIISLAFLKKKASWFL